MNPQIEIWSPILGFEGYYSVSSAGRVRSEPRTVKHGAHTRKVPGGILKTPPNGQGYPTVHLSRDGVGGTHYVHDLVIASFFGRKPNGLEVRHLSDEKTDCCLGNLALGTRSDNMRDAVRNGRNHNSNKVACIRGHAFDSSNTYLDPSTGARCCRACRRRRSINHRKIGAAA